MREVSGGERGGERRRRRTGPLHYSCTITYTKSIHSLLSLFHFHFILHPSTFFLLPSSFFHSSILPFFLLPFFLVPSSFKLLDLMLMMLVLSKDSTKMKVPKTKALILSTIHKSMPIYWWKEAVGSKHPHFSLCLVESPLLYRWII